MLSRKHERWVIPAVLLVAVFLFFSFQRRNEYLSDTVTKWVPYPKWREQQQEAPPKDKVQIHEQQDLKIPPSDSSQSSSDSKPVAVPFGSSSDSSSGSDSTSAAPTADIKKQANGLYENAHRLRHPDDFLPHFKAVVQLPDLSSTDARKSCDWDQEKEPLNFMFGHDEKWVKEEKPAKEIGKKRKQWHKFISEGAIPWSQVKDKFSGRGIVILVGNGNTAVRLLVTLRFMQNAGYKLPVEIHYWRNELDESEKVKIASSYHTITFNDLSAQHNIFHAHSDWIANFNLKSAALLNSRFAEALLLDSDNLPVLDPNDLFESDMYKEYGSIFWPDIARTRPENPMFQITNTPCRKDEFEQESGQLVLDKRRLWYHIQLAAWFNNQPYYMGFLLGDKDHFRFAWKALKTEFGKPERWLTSVGLVFPDGKYCGGSFAQHHPNGSVAFVHGGLFKTWQPSLNRWITKYHGNKRLFQHYKRSPHDKDHAYLEKVGIYYHGCEFADPKPGTPASCTNMEDVEARDLDEIVPNLEDRFKAAGGYWILEGEDSHM